MCCGLRFWAGRNPNLPDLYGGSFVRSSTGQLRAQLVFSPGTHCALPRNPAYNSKLHSSCPTAEGEPWMVLARAKKSVELLCQLVSEPDMRVIVLDDG